MTWLLLLSLHLVLYTLCFLFGACHKPHIQRLYIAAQMTPGIYQRLDKANTPCLAFSTVNAPEKKNYMFLVNGLPLEGLFNDEAEQFDDR